MIGILGAAHPNGIQNNYMAEFQPQYVSPLVNGADPGIPGRAKKDIATKGYDVVYMPYCTGDVHVGNNVVTYTDPLNQNPPIVWRHVGYNNTKAALAYLRVRQTFGFRRGTGEMGLQRQVVGLPPHPRGPPRVERDPGRWRG